MSADGKFSVPGHEAAVQSPQESKSGLFIALGMLLGIPGLFAALLSGVLFWDMVTTLDTLGVGEVASEPEIMGTLQLDGPIELWLLGGRDYDLGQVKLEISALAGGQRTAAILEAGTERWKKYYKKGNPNPLLLVGTLAPPAPGSYEFAVRVVAKPAAADPTIYVTRPTGMYRTLFTVVYYAGLVGLFIGPPLFLIGLFLAMTGKPNREVDP